MILQAKKRRICPVEMISDGAMTSYNILYLRNFSSIGKNVGKVIACHILVIFRLI